MIEKQGMDDPGVQKLQAFVYEKSTRLALQQMITGIADLETEFFDGDIHTAIDLYAHENSPQVLLVDICRAADPVTLMDKLAAVCQTHTRVIAIGDREDLALFRALSDLGVTDYIVLPAEQSVLTAAINKAMGYSRSRERLGRQIAVVGCNGGCGTTTIAANLAWSLAHQDNAFTVVADYDFYTGDLDLLLGVTANSNFRLLLHDAKRLDELLLERSLVEVSERLKMLKAVGPDARDESIRVSPEALANLNYLLKKQHNYVVWDLPARALYNESGASLMLGSNTIVLVVNHTLASIRQLVFTLKQLGQRQDQKIYIVHNHTDPGKHASISQAQIEQAIANSIDLQIPYWPQFVASAAEQGRPFVQQGNTPALWQTLIDGVLGRESLPAVNRWRRWAGKR